MSRMKLKKKFKPFLFLLACFVFFLKADDAFRKGFHYTRGIYVGLPDFSDWTLHVVL